MQLETLSHLMRENGYLRHQGASGCPLDIYKAHLTDVANLCICKIKKMRYAFAKDRTHSNKETCQTVDIDGDFNFLLLRSRDRVFGLR